MYRSKREVLSSIKEKLVKHDNGYYTIFLAYLGRDPITKEKVRVARADKSKLRDYINEFYTKLDIGGDEAVYLDRQQAHDAKVALDLLAQSDLEMSLAECVRAVIEGRASAAVAPCATTTRP